MDGFVIFYASLPKAVCRCFGMRTANRFALRWGYPGTDGEGLRPVQDLQRVGECAFAVHPHLVILDEDLADDIHPGIYYEYSGVRDTVRCISRFVLLVQDAERLDGCRVDIREERIGNGSSINEYLLQLRRVVSNRNNADASLLEVRYLFLQLHELPSAVGSPVRRAYRDEDCPARAYEPVDAGDLLALVECPDGRKPGADRQAWAESIRIFGNEHIAGKRSFKESNNLATEKLGGRGVQYDSREGQAQDNHDCCKTFKDLFQVTLRCQSRVW